MSARWFTVTELDPWRRQRATFGLDRQETEQFGCTHRIDVFEDGKLAFGTVHKGETAAQMEIDRLLAQGYRRREPNP